MFNKSERVAERSGREDHSEKFGFLCILGHIYQTRRGQAPPPAAQIKAIFVLTIILASLVGDLVATLKMSSCYGAGSASGVDGSKAQLFSHVRSLFCFPPRFGGAATLPANFLSTATLTLDRFGEVPSKRPAMDAAQVAGATPRQTRRSWKLRAHRPSVTSGRRRGVRAGPEAPVQPCALS